jgi:hypothetical protein
MGGIQRHPVHVTAPVHLLLVAFMTEATIKVIGLAGMTGTAE